MIRTGPLLSLGSACLYFLSIFVCPAKAAAADEIVLGWPVRCEPGVTCFVQSYVDHDASSQIRDYQCGGRTYDGHDGTDIRIPDLDIQRKGVEVLAAAAGTVTAIRDGVDDVSVRTAGKAAIAGKECGNGVVVEHANGWRTQYCHMAKGSVRVSVGDHVTAGHSLGLIGLSGETEFPHLHLHVRRLNKIVDPFAYEAVPNACGSGHSIWVASISEQTKYRARDILNHGFADLPTTMELVESGEILKHLPNLESDALVAYVRAIGLKEGDQQTLIVRGPDGAVLSEYKAPVLERDKAQYFVASGRKRKGANWAPGTYTAKYRVTRNEEEVLRRDFEIKLGPK